MLKELNSVKIISIAAKKYSDSCYVKLSNDDTLLLNIDIISKNCLVKGKEIDSQSLESIINAQRLIDIRKTAYRFASYKPRSIFQIKQKLIEKGFITSEINIAIKFLLEFNLLDDIKFTENFIKNKAQNKKYGINRIRIELKKAGIDNNTIDDSLQSFYPKESAIDLAREASNKKMKMLSLKPIEKQRNSLIQFLLRHGYNWEIINIIIKEYF